MQTTNTSCTSCECPCDLSNSLRDVKSSKSKINKTENTEVQTKSNEGLTASSTSQSDDKDDTVSKQRYKVEEISADIKDHSKNLIQSGIVIDISSLKEKGLEHADKHCKLI